MKNLLFGMAIGVIVGYAFRKMEDDGKLDRVREKGGEWADKAKKKVKNLVDTTVNEVEYIADRVEDRIDTTLEF
ncbi:hypothetical protein LJC35_05365 [Parabacteroides sp. OttesenSCG-928-N08]|nr:hypothetical protein [Parabacteroides sp. OttesenSCG-928-N08]